MTALVSAVVPTFRRPDLLRRCLDTLLAQSIDPASYEIVIADDGPDDAVRALVATTPARCALRYVPVTATQGPAGARNAGWRAARGDVIAFADDDTVPDRDWLLAGLRGMSGGSCAVTGRIVMPVPERPTDYEKDAAGLARAEFVTANCFVRRTVLERIGGFDERFTSAWREDSDLHFRLLEAGCGIGHAPDAVVVHPVREAPFGVSVSQQRKVVFDALLYRKHPRLYRERIRRIPPIDYYVASASLLAATVAALAGRPQAALVASVPWLLVTAFLTLGRLRGTRHSLRHVTEMLLTSAAIPPTSVFWRGVGSARHRVLFL